MRSLAHTLNVVIPLFLGGTIYLLFRSEHLLMFRWVESIGMYDLLSQMRLSAGFLRHELPDWVIFSFPNSLWFYSLLSFVHWIWKRDRVVDSILLAFLSCVVVSIKFFSKDQNDRWNIQLARFAPHRYHDPSILFIQ